MARTGLARASPAFIAAKVATDEAVFGPLHVAGFYAFVTAGEGGSWQVRCLKDKHTLLLGPLAVSLPMQPTAVGFACLNIEPSDQDSCKLH